MGAAACAKLILCGPPVQNAVQSVVNAVETYSSPYGSASGRNIEIDDEAVAKATILLDPALKAAREAEKVIIMGVRDLPYQVTADTPND